MENSSYEHKQKVIKFVQELLLDEENRTSITPAIISQKVDLVVGMNPKWGQNLDRESVTDELIRRFSLWIGQDSTLKNDAGHTPWLSFSRKMNWKYWQRYREWLERKLSWKAVDALDKSTDEILGLLEDPSREGKWDRRGLVVGHVQSGKTSNYTGLICKASDAGYKIIIVLTGLHNNLRTQTQIRMEEGFLGYETPLITYAKIVGVGEFDSDWEIHPNCATNRSEKGDFNTRIGRQLAITPEQRPWLFVVKKNKTVLKELLKWIQNHAADINNVNIEGPSIDNEDLPRVKKNVTKLPLMIIDDEADHASVNTREQVFDANGNPDEEHSPSKINKLIRRILHSFSRASYVGYTATPYANIFIHERGETHEEGPDLFPSSFIINLAGSSNYIGPARVFGLPSTEGRKGDLPLVRPIKDDETDDGIKSWMPRNHKNGYNPRYDGKDTLPPSLIEAIDAFMLTCSIRRIRGQIKEHNSMLIHVTRFTSVQKEVYRQVEDHLRHIRQRIFRKIDHEQILERLKKLLEEDFLQTFKDLRKLVPDQTFPQEPSWKEIQATLPEVISDMEMKLINGTAKDVLDYTELHETGLNVIVIGGDKLSRGLTLDGLSVSYFLRSSRMYDTLMQMGRWFGYRPGYLDLCRLYTTQELKEWFEHISDASEELREEFDLMVAAGSTPREYGLKVQSHPVLMVTSQLKMRTARNLMLSFSGRSLETVVLFRNFVELQQNLAAAKNLFSNLENPEIDPVRMRGDSRHQWKGYLWNNVSYENIIEFMRSYLTHPEAIKVNSNLIAEFIQSMVTNKELTNWTVALIGGGDGNKFSFSEKIYADMLIRKDESPDKDRYSIGRLLSPRDEAIDLDQEAWAAALSATRSSWRADPARGESEKEPVLPNGPSIRKIRGFGAEKVNPHPERGLLLIYALDPLKASENFPKDTPPIIAFGISFPGSNSGLKVEYKVNNVLWEQEYGPSE